MNGRIKSIGGGRSRAENPRLRKIPLQDVKCIPSLDKQNLVDLTWLPNKGSERKYCYVYMSSILGTKVRQQSIECIGA